MKTIFLEGAGWNKKNACLIEPLPMQLVCEMPIIWFKPMEVLKKKTKGEFRFASTIFVVRHIQSLSTVVFV